MIMNSTKVNDILKTIQKHSDFLKLGFQMVAAKSSSKPANSNFRQKLQGASHFEEFVGL